jgi:uncharacterized protein YsxB (DUF464 family)
MKKQTFLTESQPDCIKMIIEAFLNADIPLQKLNNEKVKKMFETFNFQLPSITTARKHIIKLAEEHQKTLCELFKNKMCF